MNSSFKLCAYHRLILKNISLFSQTSWNLVFHDRKFYHRHCPDGDEKLRICKQNDSSCFIRSKSFNFSPLRIGASTRSFSTSRPVNSLQSSQVSDLFFPDFPTIYAAESTIVGIHDLTGLPWWSSIIVSAFILRTLLPLPLSVYSVHNSLRLQRLQPEIKEVVERLKKEVAMAMRQFGWDEKKAKGEYNRNLRRHLRRLYIRDNCHPMKDTASFWIRIPLWVSASYGLRNMCLRATNPYLENHESCQSLSTEGIAWFTDLTMVDSTLILPVMMGLVTLLNVEIGRRSVSEMTTYRRVLTYFLRSLSLAFIPISAYLPTGLVLYWISSGLFSAIQTGFIDRSSTYHRLIGVKDAMDHQQAPKESKSSSSQK